MTDLINFSRLKQSEPKSRCLETIWGYSVCVWTGSIKEGLERMDGFYAGFIGKATTGK